MPESAGRHPPVRALLLSLAALAVPIAGRLWIPEAFENYEALLWLIAVVPAFLLAYYRGWRGAATALASAMAVVSITYAATTALQKPVPELLPAILVFIIAISLAAGALAERLGREARTALATTGDFTDASTGLPTRAHAELHLEIEFSAAQRGRPLAVVLLDLDNFSGYNEQHGRNAGDEILHILGDVLKRSTRRMNLTARFGDDAFLCILSGADDDGAMVFVNRFQEGLRAIAGQRALPSVSGGVASYGPTMRTHHDLVAAAESALKQAKSEGRGRVRVHGRSIDLPLAIGAGTTGESLDGADASIERVPNTVVLHGRGRGRKALIVAADQALRLELARILMEDGFTVAQVSNIVDGVQCLTIEYDLLFTEVSLTEGTGSELVRTARLRWPSIQVLGIVEDGPGEPLIEVLNAGIDRYLTTPLDATRIRQHVTELLVRRDRLATSARESRQLSLEYQARANAAVEALRHSEEEYQTVVASLHEVVFRTDTSGHITALNSAWAEATGYGVNESLEKHIADFVHEEDRAEFTAAISALIAGDAASTRTEVRVIAQNGDVRWFELRMRRSFDADNNVSGLAGMLDDVTARKHSEQALLNSEESSRLLLSALPDEVYRLSREGVILTFEGQTPDDATHKIGGSIEQVFPSAVAAALRQRIERVLRSGGSELYEYRVLDGTELCEFEVRLARGGPNDVVAIVRNVTGKKLLEQQLRQSQKLEAVGRLAGGLAHDFNNLLTVVQGNAQIISDEPLSDSVRDSVQEIRQAAERGAQLVKQLLAFGRRQLMQTTILNLNTVIEATRARVARLLGENITLAMDLDPELGLIKADPSQVEQILIDLAVNARDAMQSKGGTMYVATRNAVMVAHDANDGVEDSFVVLTVSDDGVGMDAETRERVFEPFFTTKSFAQASGLGLATVYGIVRQSGGTISVSSEPGRGTAFEIALPRVDV